MEVTVLPSESEQSEQRYTVLRTLGQGGAGAVYLAQDRESGEHVALKKLLRIDQKGVLRLKREFRSLADIHHPNLVKLYDLGHASDGWFITMEYLAGTDLLGHVQRASDVDVGSTRELDSLAPARTPVDQKRLLDAFQQLARGVHALHRAGMLHRDLKPSNVMVDRGRVVVLDFGLVRELEQGAQYVTQEGSIAGTPAYMAPEQALAQTLGEATDWYAFGVMFYQAWSGRLPIDARSSLELLQRKCEIDPIPLDEAAVGVPEPLADMCMALLSREPAERPRGDDILALLEKHSAEAAQPRAEDATGEITLHTGSRTLGGSTSPLFGRDAELQRLKGAVSRALLGEAVVVHVRGASGAGKSALLEHFLDRVEQGTRSPGGRDPLVLRSRCYEREAMPFKALDGLMDSLVKQLSLLDDFEVGHLLPAELGELVQLFPVFERLPAVPRLLATTNLRVSQDAIQTRSRAEAALRELFGRLSSRRLVVLWIDDLQWGDLDSATILRSWLDELAESSVLFVFSYRSEEATTSSCLRAMLEEPSSRSKPRPEELWLELPPLGDDDVRRLCQQRLGNSMPAAPDLVERIAHQAAGNPFLVSQLSALALAQRARGDTDLTGLSMEQLVVRTSALLPPEARSILHVLAIAGRPLGIHLALAAAGAQSDGRALLHALRGLRLIRTRLVAGERLLELYHDRVRESVQAAMDEAARARVHGQLLHELERTGAEADWLHTLALGAGQRAAALEYGLVAAERADQMLAFERAVELYQGCLSLIEDDAAESGEIWLKLAVALARCRRGVKAAEAYLEAARHSGVADTLSLLRLAASHLLRSGQFEEGEVLVRKVLEARDLELPRGELKLMAAIGWERAALALRGLHFERREANEVPKGLLEQSILFTSLSLETQAYDPLRAALLQARGLRWALSAGEPAQVVRALYSAATMASVTGTRAAGQRADELLALAEKLARELGSQPLYGEVLSSRAVSSFLLGRPADVLAPADEAEKIERVSDHHDATGQYYLRFTVMATRAGALNVLGQGKRFLRELDRLLEEARETDNRGVVLQLALSQTTAEELRNQVHLSRKRLDLQRAQLPAGCFGVLHTLHMIAVMRVASSTGDFAWADQILAHDWPTWQRSPVRASAFMSLLARGAHMRLLLNQHVIERRSGDPAELVKEDLRAVARSPFAAWRSAWSAVVLGRLALMGGHTNKAETCWRDAAKAFDGLGILQESARLRYALALLASGPDAATLRAAAHEKLRDIGVVDPTGELQAHFPELLAKL